MRCRTSAFHVQGSSFHEDDVSMSDASKTFFLEKLQVTEPGSRVAPYEYLDWNLLAGIREAYSPRSETQPSRLVPSVAATCRCALTYLWRWFTLTSALRMHRNRLKSVSQIIFRNLARFFSRVQLSWMFFYCQKAPWNSLLFDSENVFSLEGPTYRGKSPS